MIDQNLRPVGQRPALFTKESIFILMRMITIYINSLFFLFACSTPSDPNIYIPPYEPPVAYAFADTPVWADEFDYTGNPDPSKWDYDLGGHGWGNNELQFYTNDPGNVKVEDGVLVITAMKESVEGNDYTSGRLVSREKGDFLYGRIEVSAKLPAGRGTWPAIWMLPTDWKYGSWPKSGEIDIMEHVGYDQDRVHITVHTEAYNHTIGTQVGKSKVIDQVTEAFHKYRIDWTPNRITGFIDDAQVFSFKNEGKGSATWPFDRRFHLLLNIAVGGNWGGVEGVDENAFPATMEIDYVRVYELIEE